MEEEGEGKGARGVVGVEGVVVVGWGAVHLRDWGGWGGGGEGMAGGVRENYEV